MISRRSQLFAFIRGGGPRGPTPLPPGPPKCTWQKKKKINNLMLLIIYMRERAKRAGERLVNIMYLQVSK